MGKAIRAAGVALALPAALLAAGCSAGGDPATGGVSQREADALNDAAAALDDNGADAIVDTNAADSAGNVE